MMTTPEQTKQAEEEAREDAKDLALLLLLRFRNRDGLNPRGETEIVWDASTAKFRINGRAVSIRSVRAMLSRIEERLGRRLIKITKDLEDGKITFAKWQKEFERTIKSAHILAGALALGSISAAARNVTVRNRITDEISFAREFSLAALSGNAGSYRKIAARAKSYMQAAHITYSEAVHLFHLHSGIAVQAKRVMRKAEHCKPCIRFAGIWMDIDKIPPIGSIPRSVGGCERHCKCYIVYRKA